MRRFENKTKNREDSELFKSDSDWIFNACLNYLPDHLHTYIVGYKHAADILVEYVCENQSDQDILVYPIAFLYRHHLELQLKFIISKGSILLGEDKQPPATHKLDDLWEKCKAIIEKLSPEDGPDLAEIENIIDELTKFDPYSTAFRYPKNKQGKSSLYGVNRINLRLLSEIIEKVSIPLDGVITYIVECLQEIEIE